MPQKPVFPPLSSFPFSLIFMSFCIPPFQSYSFCPSKLTPILTFFFLTLHHLHFLYQHHFSPYSLQPSFTPATLYLFSSYLPPSSCLALSLLLRCRITVESSACPVITFFTQPHPLIGPVSSYHVM